MNVGIAIFPTSWHLGLWSREKKSIFALGPLRFVWYKQPGAWTPPGHAVWTPPQLAEDGSITTEHFHYDAATRTLSAK